MTLTPDELDAAGRNPSARRREAFAALGHDGARPRPARPRRGRAVSTGRSSTSAPEWAAWRASSRGGGSTSRAST